MSNATDSTGVAAAMLDAFIKQTFDNFVLNAVAASSTTLVLYTIILNMSQEIEYIWLNSFSPPVFFYTLTRYAILIGGGLLLAADLLPMPVSLLRTCDIISYTTNCVQLLGYIGVQGLLVTRAYSLCHGNKIVVAALVFSFLAGLVLSLLVIISFGNCFVSINVPAELSLLNLLSNITVILTDVLVFGVCVYDVWDARRLQRDVHFQGNGSLVSVFFRQLISRFSFTIILSVAFTVIQMSIHNFAVVDILGSIQQCLSSVLLSGFTLELRQCNSAAITANNITLPPIRSVPDILYHIHQSVLVEMGDSETRNAGVLPPQSLNFLQPENKSVHAPV